MMHNATFLRCLLTGQWGWSSQHLWPCLVSCLPSSSRTRWSGRGWSGDGNRTGGARSRAPSAQDTCPQWKKCSSARSSAPGESPRSSWCGGKWCHTSCPMFRMLNSPSQRPINYLQQISRSHLIATKLFPRNPWTLRDVSFTETRNFLRTFTRVLISWNSQTWFFLFSTIRTSRYN